MLRRLFRCLAPMLLVLSLSFTPAQAQQAAPAEAEKSEPASSALPYFILALYTMLVLTIVCMPSRKA